jgi:hypothetical protein
MVLADWLGLGTPREVVIGAVVVLLVLVVLVVRFVQKLMLRMVLVALMVVVGIGVYVSRDELAECTQTCSCELFGRQVDVPACRERFPGD